MSLTPRDTRYMVRALRLAAKGRGLTSPNPMVGAVVVAGNRILGAGYHRQAGGPHAEIVALQEAARRARGATLYVTLEPCNHRKKRTAPCVPAIVKSGVRRVVVAMPDPNPQVNGHGLRQLQRAGVTVDVGCLRQEAAHLNESYCHWVTTGRPLVILKAATTLDGKIATKTGESQWITGEMARRHAHQLRRQVDAVMVGVGTILHDDPQLTARGGLQRQAAGRRQPLRVILDSRLRIPLTAKVLRGAIASSKTGRTRVDTLIATSTQAPQARLKRLRSLGVPVLVVPSDAGRLSLRACLKRLGRMGITSVMIEGGSEVNASALRTGYVDRVVLYVAPMLLGGKDATSVIGGVSPTRLASAVRLDTVRVRRLGKDVLVEGCVARHRAGQRARPGT